MATKKYTIEKTLNEIGAFVEKQSSISEDLLKRQLREVLGHRLPRPATSSERQIIQVPKK